ncbi:TPA: hybrid sensor histidine kinase/response regulator, partial [Candidatus Poribacteria bacterium]|nr:hybrid sensor histidine kinase/response regulator [Candidatus Poribacteria bacterium]
KGNFAQIVVSDTGIGIPKHLLSSLFTPFFTTKSSGTGLGLAVAKQVVVKHGGFIDVESEENAGSTFTVNLPMERRDEAEKTDTPVPDPRGDSNSGMRG